MKRLIYSMIFLLLLLPSGAAAETGVVTSTDLIEQSQSLDGLTITYTGEVIGDIMQRGAYTWINVSDGTNAIGVWTPTALLGDIQLAGRYATRGDVVTVTGVFNKACREHGGDLDIHALQIVLISKGYSTTHAINPYYIALTVFFVLVDIMIFARVLSKKR